MNEIYGVCNFGKFLLHNKIDVQRDLPQDNHVVLVYKQPEAEVNLTQKFLRELMHN